MLSSVSLGPFFTGLCGRMMDVVAFAHEAAADVLVDEDELLAQEEFRRAERGAVLVDAVGRDVVGRALQHDGVGLRVREDVLGDVDGGEQLDAVAHGDAVLELGVVFTNCRCTGSRALRCGRGHGAQLCCSACARLRRQQVRSE